MKKILSVVLALTLCLALFAGCTTKTVVENEVEETEGKIISALPETVDIDNLDSCTVAISLEEGDAYVDDSGKMQMDIKVYSYELYDMVDIANLEVGDTFVRRGEEIKITEIERLETGLIYVNGGQEMGGFDLYSNDNTVYYEAGMNDAKFYYELGEVTLPVSTEFEYIDESDLDSQLKTYYPGDLLTDDAGIVYDFNPQNTRVVIEGGEIIRMNKVYIP